MSRDEENFWLRTIFDARHDRLAATPKFAMGWSIVLIAVFAIFSAAAFATGFTGLDRLADSTRDFVRGVVVVAIVATLAAALSAGSAVLSTPRRSGDAAPETLRSDYRAYADNTVRRLRRSVVLVVFSALAWRAAQLTVALADSAPATEPPLMMAVFDGKMLCSPARSRSRRHTVAARQTVERGELRHRGIGVPDLPLGRSAPP
ncbi:hypothetical protein ACQP1G_12805 [Nocardia sp. CA-107356]|uniref:hypothetical protein n=1 Tax=Nocardia sp. CA-107356 TaxID=3239972 RepID=UPI003D8E8945